MTTLRALGLAFFGTLALAGQGQAAGFSPSPAASPAIYETSQRTSFYVEMRDGVKLAVDLYRPIQNGQPVSQRLPVIWQATNDRSSSSSIGGEGHNGLRDTPTLTRFGYVVAVVDRRGIGASTGTRRGYHDRNEDADSYEMTEWLAAQPWSDSHVGIYGCSNTGEAVMHAVSMAPPHLKAAFAGCFSWNKYDGMARGGIFANWGTGPERTLEQDMSLRPVDTDASRIELRQAAEDHLHNTVLRDLWAGMPYRDSYSPLVASRFWSEGSVSSYADQVRQSGVPIYILAGQFDDFRGQALTAFANLPDGKRRLLLGPWKHCQNTGFDLLSEMRRFFDFYLKGQDDDGFFSEPPIHYFTLNAAKGEEWRAAADWPLSGVALHQAYLGRGGELQAASPARLESPVAFRVRYDVDCIRAGKPDPLTLATMVYAQPCPMASSGPQFTTAPLQKDLEISGTPSIDLWIKADQPDANLFIYLEDVAPDGSGQPMTDARLKASLRKTSAAPWKTNEAVWRRAFREDAQPLAPGEPALLTISFLPVSYLVKSGHRLRMTVAGADYRERDRTPPAVAPNISILTGGAHASRLSLPIKESPSK